MLQLILFPFSVPCSPLFFSFLFTSALYLSAEIVHSSAHIHFLTFFHLFSMNFVMWATLPSRPSLFLFSSFVYSVNTHKNNILFIFLFQPNSFSPMNCLHWDREIRSCLRQCGIRLLVIHSLRCMDWAVCPSPPDRLERTNCRAVLRDYSIKIPYALNLWSFKQKQHKTKQKTNKRINTRSVVESERQL